MTSNICKLSAIALAVLSITLAGCRREVPSYEPMKLGGSIEPAR